MEGKNKKVLVIGVIGADVHAVGNSKSNVTDSIFQNIWGLLTILNMQSLPEKA